MKNHGLNLVLESQARSTDDWQFGAFSKPCLVSIPEEEREQYLPQGELQYGKEDFMSCSTITTLDVLETKFNYAIRNGIFSDENIEWLYNKGYIVFD